MCFDWHKGSQPLLLNQTVIYLPKKRSVSSAVIITLEAI
jgi:hypothetical protein